MSGVEITSEAIHLPAELHPVLDVLFDDQRVFAISPERHRVREDGRRLVPWPRAIVPYLHGKSVVALRTHLDEKELCRAEVTFDDVDERVRIRDDQGFPLAMTKWGSLQRPFEANSPDADRLLDDLQELLGILNDELGKSAFLAYGTLLGAVRSGKYIGHDTDADIALYSRHQHPADIVRESHHVQRELARRGWRTLRLSGAFVQVWKDESASAQRKIDIFTAYHLNGWFAMTRWVRAHLAPEAILPLGSVSLEGLTFPAPHDPEALLEATYGPGWRVPDPTFKFSFPPSMQLRTDGWFGWNRSELGRWRQLTERGEDHADPQPSTFARFVRDRLPDSGTLVDVGSGSARDALWFADQGYSLIGLDYRPSAVEASKRLASERGTNARFEELSLYDLRVALCFGARLQRERPYFYARNLVEGLRRHGRANLWLMAKSALARGGALFLEFRTAEASDGSAQDVRAPWLYTFDPDALAAEIGERGGTVVDRTLVSDTHGQSCRMEVTWNR